MSRTTVSHRLVAAAVAAGLLAAAVPGAALAGGGKPEGTKAQCDPKVQVCDSGRKNG